MNQKIPNDFLIVLVEKSEKEKILDEAEKQKVPAYEFLRQAILEKISGGETA